MGDPLDDLMAQMGQERVARGQASYDYDEKLDDRLFSLDLGFIPSMRLGHYLGMEGLPATLVDIGTDLPNLVGPQLVAGLSRNIFKKGLLKGTAAAASEFGAGVKNLPAVAATKTRDYSARFKEFLKTGTVGQKILFPEEVDQLMAKGTKAVKGAGLLQRSDMELRGIHEATVADKQWNAMVADAIEKKGREIGDELIEMPTEVSAGAKPTATTDAVERMKAARREMDRLKQANTPATPGPMIKGKPSINIFPKWKKADRARYEELKAEIIAAKQEIQAAHKGAEPVAKGFAPGTKLTRRQLLNEMAQDERKFFNLPDDMAAARGERARLSAAYRIAREAGERERAAEILKDLRVARRELPQNFRLSPDNLKPEWKGKVADDDVAILNSWREHQANMADYLGQEGLIRGYIDEYMARSMTFPTEEAADKARVIMQRKYGGTPETLSSFSQNFLRRGIPLWDDFKEVAKQTGGKLKDDFFELVADTYRSVGKAAADKRALRYLASFNMTDDAMGEKLPMVVVNQKDIPAGYERYYKFTDKDPIIHSIAREQAILKREKEGRALFARVNQSVDKIGEASVTGDPRKLMAVKAKEQERINQALGEAMNGPGRAGAYVYKPALGELRNMYGYGLARGKEAVTGVEKGLKSALWLNSIAKRLSLSLSLFHFVALTESAVADLGWDFIRHPFKALRFAQTEIHRASDIMEMAVRSGLQLGPMLDAEATTLKSGLDTARQWLDKKGLLGKAGNAALFPLRGFEFLAGKVDKALWGYYHNGLKIFAFNEIFADALKRPQFASMKADDIARSVAQHVNGAFGGLNWQRWWFSPKGQDALRLLMFAPDWTLSNIMTAADVWTNALRIGPGEKLPTAYLLADDVRAYYARQFAFRSRLYLGSMMNLANYAFTSFKGEGHWMDQNAPGAKGWVEMPWVNEQGGAQYYRFGKHFNEMSEMLRIFEDRGGPLQFLKRKAASVPRVLTTIAFGENMNGTPLVGVNDGPLKEMAVKFGYGASHFEPFGVKAIREFAMDYISPPKKRAPEPFMSSLLSAAGLPTYSAPKVPKEKTWWWEKPEATRGEKRRKAREAARRSR